MFYDLEFLILVLYTQVKIYMCDVALSVSTPNKLKLKFEIKPKVAGRFPQLSRKVSFSLPGVDTLRATSSTNIYLHLSARHHAETRIQEFIFSGVVFEDK
jgi:hypothetical protein